MWSRALDLIWPRDCEICGESVDRPARHVCSACLERIPFVPVDGCCRRCGRDVPEFTGEFVCEDCRIHKPSFDRAASALRFGGEARKMMLDFKYRRHLWLKDDFADWLEAAARARFRVGEIDAVIAMPARRLHRFLRGYNQCDIIARALACRLGVPLAKGLVKLDGSTKRQAGLEEDERRANVKGAFAVTARASRYSGRSVLLVDDVMTTGATLSECAAALKEAGIARVWALSLLRSVKDR